MNAKWLSRLLLLGLTSCGFVTDEQELITNGVKNISPYINKGNDKGAYLQDAYRISATSRLLIRREDMLEKRHALIVDSTHPVKLSLQVLQASERAAALAALQLCPLKKNWMMLATWEKAHPFSADGEWQRAGGDYLEDSCVAGQADAQNATQINFDVTSLIEARLVGLGEAYGFLLISENQTIEIVGDAHPSRAPRMSWTEVKGWSMRFSDSENSPATN